MRKRYEAYAAICVFALCGSFFIASLLFHVVRAQETIVRTDRQEGDYVPVDTDEESDGAVLIREDPEIEKLKDQINNRAQRIETTEKEIENINRELSQIYKKKDTLESELNILTLTNRRNEARIHVTESNIHQGHLKLTSLNSSIDNNEENIGILRNVLIQNYQRANEFELRGDSVSVILNPSFFEALRHLEELDRYSSSLRSHLDDLERETREMEKNKEDVHAERVALKGRQRELEDRRQIYKFSIVEKESLVKKTKNDETEYQKLLREKQAERLALLQELYEYESRIEYLRDPDSLPKARSGLLRIPFDGRPRVTQEFGETAFSRRNAHKYGSAFHAGIDFGIPSGTALLSSADGIVTGTGNTDLVPRCQSWGKWVLIKHPFGLSTLYAHLSLVKVRLGQKVNAGDLIGYSGNTGFSTGPHLHFGVYDSNGVQVVSYEQISRAGLCRGILVPVSAPGAKLNPRDYLAL